MTVRRRWICGVLAAASVAAAGCRQDAQYEKPLTPVVVQAVGTRAGGGGIRYSATIEPNTRVDLAFKRGGYVREIHTIGGGNGRIVQEGDHVTAGTVLARVREGDYQQKVDEARTAVAEAEASLAHAQSQLDRATALYASKSIPKTDLDGAQAQVNVINTKLDGARAVVREAEAAMADTALVAPLNAVVMKRLIEVGSLVGPGTPGFVLADTTSVKVVFGAPDTMVRSLKPGMPQTVITEAIAGTEFQGRISRISPVADARSRVFDVEVTIPNPRDELKVGMIAALQVDEAVLAAAPSVVTPLSAVIRSKTEPDGYAVFVVEEAGGRATARLRNVTLGDAVGNQIAVRTGLRPGERVIVRGATLVTDGQQVRVAS